MHDKVVTITPNPPLLSAEEIIHKNNVLFTFLDDRAPSCDLRVRKADVSADACTLGCCLRKTNHKNLNNKTDKFKVFLLWFIISNHLNGDLQRQAGLLSTTPETGVVVGVVLKSAARVMAEDLGLLSAV